MIGLRIFSAVCAVLVVWQAFGAEPKADALASEARACRKRGAEVLQNYDNLANGHISQHGDYVRDDVKLAKPAYEAEAALWQKASAAYEQGDAGTGQSLRAQAEEAKAVTTLWRER